MTIVAGFKCEGGVVLCADTQETANQMKLTVEKLVLYKKDWCQGGVGGSGYNSDIIDTVVERVIETLDKGYDDISKIRLSIQGTLVRVYANEINLHPCKDYEKVVDLLIAVRPKQQQSVTLFKANATVLRTISTQEVIGAGDIIKYIAQSLFRDNMPINQGVLLGSHLVSMAKKYVEGCGGPTQSLIVASDGRTQLERVEDIERQEYFFDQFNDALRQITLLCADTNISDDLVFEGIDAFAQRVKNLRERHMAQEIEEEVIQAITDPETFQSRVYHRLATGFRFRLPQRAMEVMQAQYEEQDRIARELQAKTETKTETTPPDSQKSENQQ